MDVRQLRYFIRVAELGSFSRASQDLAITQPSVSRQVRQLEVQLGHTLLTRNGRGVELTEAGKVVLELGRGLLRQMDRVYAELGQLDGTVAGRVSVGMPPTWTRLIVLPFTQLLHRALPHASLTLTEALSANLREEVLQGKLDIALLYDAAPAPELELVTLKNEEVIVVSRAGDPGAMASEPVMLQQLAAMPLIMPGRPNVVRMFLEREACAAGLRPNIAYDIDGLASILDLVREGTGHALLPRSSVQNPCGEFRTRRVGPAGLWMPLMLAVSSRRPVTQTQRAALEILTDLARTTTAQGPACKA